MPIKQIFVDDEDNTALCRMHETILCSKGPTKHKSVQSVRFSANDEEIQSIMQKASALVATYAPDERVDATQGVVEFWRYTCEHDKKVSSPLAIHQDDYGIVKYPVYTVIFYVRKDDGISGGELGVFVDTPRCIYIPTHANKAVLMPGNVWHVPMSCKGVGVRDCIVVQMRRL